MAGITVAAPEKARGWWARIPAKGGFTDMHWMHRALGFLPVLTLALAACAAPETGEGGRSGSPAVSSAPGSTAPSSEVETDASPEASAIPAGEAGAAERIDIGVLTDDPGTVSGSQIRVLARVDEVVEDGDAFYTSPAGTAEGRLLVVLAEVPESTRRWPKDRCSGSTGRWSAGPRTSSTPPARQ